MSEPGLRSEILTSLGDRGADWDHLVETGRHPSAFLRSWWIDHAANGRTQILCCFDGYRLVGGAAFELDHVGWGPIAVERVRCVGQGPLAPDHIDIVAAPGFGTAVLREVLAWLRRPGSRLVDLDGLAADGMLARVLGRYVLTSTEAPFATLPDDMANYMAARPGKLRSTVKRTAKRLGAAGATIRRVDASDSDRALRDLARLHDERWSDDSEFLDAWDRFRVAARAGMEDGSVIVHEAVSPDGSVVATELDLRSGGSLAFYQAGRSADREWRGAGSVIKATAIEWAIDAGLGEYDLLRGDEPYKAEWAEGARQVVRVRFGSGPVGQAVAVGASAWIELGRRRGRRVQVQMMRPRTGAGAVPQSG